MTNDKLPRGYFILKELGSNRALLRDPGEKWPDDINGDPGPRWIPVIERSAFDQAIKERDEIAKLHNNLFHEFTSKHDANLQLRAELETLRFQLVGCGVAALCNTEETLNRQLIASDNPYWSVSYQDVVNATRREIALREKLTAAEAEVARLKEQVEWKDIFSDMLEEDNSINERWQNENTKLQQRVTARDAEIARLTLLFEQSVALLKTRDEAIANLVSALEKCASDHNNLHLDSFELNECKRDYAKRALTETALMLEKLGGKDE